MRRCCRATIRCVLPFLFFSSPSRIWSEEGDFYGGGCQQLGFERDEEQLKKNNEDHTKWSNVRFLPFLPPLPSNRSYPTSSLSS
jgi:hypothetical protein